MGHAAPVTRFVDIAMLPAEALAVDADCYVVVDVLRATTTIATLFAGGIVDLLAVADVDVARKRAGAEGRILLGEVSGLPPEGFDLGNSPVDAAAANVAGRGAVLFTTNGTAALCALGGRGTVVAGALANLRAVARFAAGFERVSVVCAGGAAGARFGLDDFAAAAAIVSEVASLAPGAELGDAAGLGLALLAQESPEAVIARSHHARGLERLGLGNDVAFAGRADTSGAVPVVSACGDGWALLTDAAR